MNVISAMLQNWETWEEKKKKSLIKNVPFWILLVE